MDYRDMIISVTIDGKEVKYTGDKNVNRVLAGHIVSHKSNEVVFTTINSLPKEKLKSVLKKYMNCMF